jgi:hypothetical protein
MLTFAFAPERHPALLITLPASMPVWAGAEPCLDSLYTQADRRRGDHAALHVPMRKEVEDRFGSRETRGVKVGVLSRGVPV